MKSSQLKPPSLTVGIEEEYQIIDPVTRELQNGIEKIMKSDLLQLSDVKPELHQCQVEVGTRVCDTIQEARDELVKLRRAIIEVAATHGLAIGAAGTHPISNWQLQHVTPLERYLGVKEELQDLADRLLIFGTHVDIAPERLDHGEKGLSARPGQRGNRCPRRVEVDVGILLPPVDPDALVEVALAIENAHTDKWDAEIRRRLAVIAREHAEPAAVDRHRAMHAELGAEVSDGLCSQIGLCAAEPRMLERRLGGKPAHHRVVSLEEGRIRSQRDQPGRIDVVEEIDGIVAIQVPEVFVDAAKQRASFTVPAPRKIVGDVCQAANALGSGGRGLCYHRKELGRAGV